jgi:predicted nuclease of predicted toxin-antitoxin system
MRLYLDDDLAGPILAKFLQKAQHNVQIPVNIGLSGADDAVHLTRAIRENRIIISRNYRDFENLHNLIMEATGHHPGILIVRRDDDTRRNLSPRDIVRALRKRETAGVLLRDHYYHLNAWQ